MKRIIMTVWVALVTLSALAQERKLTIEEAVFYAAQDASQPRGYVPLYPEGLQGLQWVKGADLYLYQSEGVYGLYNLKGEKVGSIGKDLGTAFPFLADFIDKYKQMPPLGYIDNEEAVFSLWGKYYCYNYKTQKAVATISVPENAENEEYNPVSRTVAYTLDNNLYLATAEAEKIAVTAIEDENIVSGRAINRNEFGINKGTFFSPKGNFLAFYQKDETMVTDYPLVDITTTPASLTNIKYPMAGQHSERAAVGVYNLKTKGLSYLDIDTSDEHFLTNLAWSPDERYILLAELNRAQNHFAVNIYEVATGKKVRTIFEERNDKWVEPESPAVFLPNKTD